MVFLGDVFSNRELINTQLISEKFGDETVVVNLESALSSEEVHEKLGPSLIVEMDNLLELCGIADIFCLANNHISDSGVSGLLKTIDVLNKKNKKYCGIDKFEFVDTYENDCKVRIYNITDEFYGNLPLLLGLDSIKRMKPNSDEVDFFVANVHMGIEGTEFINQPMMNVTNALVDLGFSCIFFHHAHVPSGYNNIHGTHVFYGLGNFIFDHGGPSTGLAVKVVFKKENLRIKVFNTSYLDNRIIIESGALPQSAQIINEEASFDYFKDHIAYHYAMAFNGAVYLLSVPYLIRYIYYSTFRRSKKREFSKKLKFQFENNTTYKYFYEWYNINNRWNR
jgi:hypothetical protein